MIPTLSAGNLPFLANGAVPPGPVDCADHGATVALVGQSVPRAKPAEGMTWADTGPNSGGGRHITGHGRWPTRPPAWAYALPAVAAVVSVAAALLGYRRLRQPAPELKLEGSRV
jgi:hypothetical protein